MKWNDVLGFCDFEDLYDRVVEKFPGGTLVEMGTFVGRSLCYLATKAKESGKPFQIYGIDICTCPMKVEDDPHSPQYVRETFAGNLYANIIDCNLNDIVSLILAPSVRSAKLFADKSVDFAFIDTVHDYPTIHAEITTWLPKMKSGSWLAGHDFDTAMFPDMCEAVIELLPSAIHTSKNCWLYEVP